MNVEKTYWMGESKYQQEYDDLFSKLVPDEGNAETLAGNLLIASSKIYHDFFNNGFDNFHTEGSRSYELLDLLSSFKQEIGIKREVALLKKARDDEHAEYEFGEDMNQETQEISEALESLMDKVVVYIMKTSK